jgi:hypothetical protein
MPQAPILALTRDLARLHAGRVAELLSLIPGALSRMPMCWPPTRGRLRRPGAGTTARSHCWTGASFGPCSPTSAHRAGWGCHRRPGRVPGRQFAPGRDRGHCRAPRVWHSQRSDPGLARLNEPGGVHAPDRTLGLVTADKRRRGECSCTPPIRAVWLRHIRPQTL